MIIDMLTKRPIGEPDQNEDIEEWQAAYERHVLEGAPCPETGPDWKLKLSREGQ